MLRRVELQNQRGAAAGVMRYEDVYQLLARARGGPRRSCYYCKRPSSKKRLHIEHKLPLCRGGTHAAENLCVACVECNVAKGTMSAEEFLRSTRFREIQAKAQKRLVHSQRKR